MESLDKEKNVKDLKIQQHFLQSIFVSLFSPDLLGREVNNGGDEVLPHGDGSDLLPVSRALSQEQADGLQGQLHGCGWIGHGTHLHQVLLLNGLNSY